MDTASLSSWSSSFRSTRSRSVLSFGTPTKVKGTQVSKCKRELEEQLAARSIREEQQDIEKFASEQDHNEITQLLSTWEQSLEEVFELQQEWESKLKKAEFQHEVDRRMYEAAKEQEIYELKEQIASLQHRPPPPPPIVTPAPELEPEPPRIAASARKRRDSVAIRSLLDGTLNNNVKRAVDGCCKLRSETRDLRSFTQMAMDGMLPMFDEAAEKINLAVVGATGTMHEKLISERAKRKRLHNLVLELKGNIRVFIRPRPLRAEEQKQKLQSVIGKIEDDETVEIIQPTTTGSAPKKLSFDHIFSPSASQEAVFKETRELVVSVLDGYNVSIFAYGQTGSGKTFTMEGTKNNRGVNYRTLETLFNDIGEREDCEFELSMSMLEIYNENVRDLISASGSSLSIREGPNGFYLPDATRKMVWLIPQWRVPFCDTMIRDVSCGQVSSMAQVLDVFSTASKNRATACTNMNEHSSRSHCILSIYIDSTHSTSGIKTSSKLHLVDLAGSERLSRSGAEGDRMREACSINKSLSCLSDVISARANKRAHVPYRNSKLTTLLYDSLSGDAKCMIYCAISSSELDISETMCTLNFASRATAVENGLAKRQLVGSDGGRRAEEMMETLKAEAAEKASKLSQLQAQVQELRQAKVKGVTELEQQNHALKADASEKQRIIIRLSAQVQELEAKNELQLRSHQKQIKELQRQVKDALQTKAASTYLAETPKPTPSRARTEQPTTTAISPLHLVEQAERWPTEASSERLSAGSLDDLSGLDSLSATNSDSESQKENIDLSAKENIVASALSNLQNIVAEQRWAKKVEAPEHLQVSHESSESSVLSSHSTAIQRSCRESNFSSPAMSGPVSATLTRLGFVNATSSRNNTPLSSAPSSREPSYEVAADSSLADACISAMRHVHPSTHASSKRSATLLDDLGRSNTTPQRRAGAVRAASPHGRMSPMLKRDTLASTSSRSIGGQFNSPSARSLGASPRVGVSTPQRERWR
jgi:hypothetical protein